METPNKLIKVVIPTFAIGLATQLAIAIYHASQHSWSALVWTIACTMITLAALVVTVRGLSSIKILDKEHAKQIEHYKLMLADMRRAGDERGEQYALSMLTIYGWKGDGNEVR